MKKKSIADLAYQFANMRRIHCKNCVVSHDELGRRVFDNIIKKALLEHGDEGRFLVELIECDNAFGKNTKGDFSGSNAVQKLFNLAKVNNPTALKLLYDHGNNT